jgi:hypothetical protein
VFYGMGVFFLRGEIKALQETIFRAFPDANGRPPDYNWLGKEHGGGAWLPVHGGKRRLEPVGPRNRYSMSEMRLECRNEPFRLE